MITPLEKIDLRDNVSGLKEWYEGYEDLEAIAFSFVVEFKNEREPLNIYADCEEEKVSSSGKYLVISIAYNPQVQTFRTFESCGWTVALLYYYVVIQMEIVNAVARRDTCDGPV